MKQQIVQAILSFYGLLLRLYPRHFREEFGEEMTAVFTEAITAIEQTEFSNLIFFCLRELRDFPLSLLQEHRRNLQANPMTTIKKTLLYLSVFIVLGLVWQWYTRVIWGSSLVSVIFSYYYWPVSLISIVIISSLFAITVFSATNLISRNVWLAVGLLTLALLFLPISFWGNPRGLIPILLVCSALVIVALLLYSILRPYPKAPDRNLEEADEGIPQPYWPNKTAVIALVLSLFLLVKAIHILYWLAIWESTGDSLPMIWLGLPLLIVLFTGISMSIVLPGKTRWAALSYLLIIPALLITSALLAERVEFRQLTQDRAERVNQALEAYYSHEGHYPQTLEQLTPRYILSLSEPVIIYGQDWCYDSGADYYRLGYVYQEHWGFPYLSGKLHKAAGDIPDLQLLCREEVTIIQEQNPDYPYEYWTANE